MTPEQLDKALKNIRKRLCCLENAEESDLNSISFTNGNGFQFDVSGTINEPIVELTTQLSPGSIPFIGGSFELTEDNSKLFWDDTNNRLGIGIATPATALHVIGDMTFSGMITNANNNLSMYQGQFGSLLIQSILPNNAFFSDNMYFNGSSWTRLNTGYGSGFHFYNGQIMIHAQNTGTGTFTQSVTAKFNRDGKLALGVGIFTTPGNYTNAPIIFDGAVGTAVFGSNLIDVSAKVELVSVTQGFLPPRMTTVQKNAISSPAEGLVVYDITLHKLCVRAAAAWETITSV